MYEFCLVTRYPNFCIIMRQPDGSEVERVECVNLMQSKHKSFDILLHIESALHVVEQIEPSPGLSGGEGEVNSFFNF